MKNRRKEKFQLSFPAAQQNIEINLEDKIMKIKICLLTLAFFVAVFSLPNTEIAAARIIKPPLQASQIAICTVSDSTGSPLNVRSTPGGKKIVAKLKNGTRVFVQYYSGDAKDQSWAEVRLKRSAKTKPLGWVLQDFLVCED